MSACRRGWTRNEFVDVVTKCEKKKDARCRKWWIEHRPWVQLRSYNSSDKAAFKALDKAWEATIENLNGVVMRHEGRDPRRRRRAGFLRADRITDGVDGLTETEAAVIGYVMSETERRGMMRITCPPRAVDEYAKVSAMTASRTLAALTAKGPRVQYSPGRPSKAGNRRGSHLRAGRPRHLPAPPQWLPGVSTIPVAALPIPVTQPLVHRRGVHTACC